MQLNQDPVCCDPERLEAYLEAALDEAVASEVEEHLSTCSLCRERLEQSAFSPQDWQSTQSLLRHDLLNACLLHLTQPDQAVPSERWRSTSAKGTRSWWVAGGIGLLLFAFSWFVFFMQLPAKPGGQSQADEQTATQADKGKQIATVLGKPIYEGDLNKNVNAKDNLIHLLLDPLMEHYCKQQGIDREEELKERIKDAQSRRGVRFFVLRFELNRHLYEKHGGRVVLTAFGPWAVDGQRKWIEGHEKAGDFEITDPQLRTQLDKLLSPDEKAALFASPDQIKAAFDPAITERFIDNYAKIPAGAFIDPALKLIGVVAGNPVYLDEQALKDPELTLALHQLIVWPLEKHYLKTLPEVAPTDAEIDALAAQREKQDAETKADYRKGIEELKKQMENLEANSDALLELQSRQRVLERKIENTGGREAAAAHAVPIKFQKHLYDNYGGGRALWTSQGIAAFDAQRKWVEERERLGEFQIPDPQIREKFYEYWTNGKERFGIRFIDDLDQAKANFTLPWLATSDSAPASASPVKQDDPDPPVGQKTVVPQKRVARSPSLIRFPLKEVATLIGRVKKKEDVTTAVTELRRIVGLDFGDGVDSASRLAWLNWWTHERDNADKAADGICDVVVTGTVTDPDGQPLADAGVLVDVPLAASPTGRYLLAQTRSDQQGRFVLAFGLAKWTREGDSALEATFTARKPPRYELRPADKYNRLLANAPPDDIAKEDDAQDNDDLIYPGKPVTMNFILHPGNTKGVDSRRQDAERYGGKTLDEWITQAKQGRRLEDREDALQIVRNFGLRHDRDKALRAFTELLSDKALTVRSLSAAGLRKAGKPTDPMAAAKLVEMISKDLSGLKLPRGTGEVDGEFGLALRVMGALEVIGETNHIPALRRVSENEKVDSIIRQFAEKAIRQIQMRELTSSARLP